MPSVKYLLVCSAVYSASKKSPASSRPDGLLNFSRVMLDINCGMCRKLITQSLEVWWYTEVAVLSNNLTAAAELYRMLKHTACYNC